MHVETVKVGRLADKSGVHQLLEQRGTHAVNVHRLARGEVCEVAQQLRGTLRARAARGALALGAVDRRAADRTAVRQTVGLRAVGALVLQHAHDLRNDLARLAHHDGVADADVLLVDEVLVVERRVRDGRSGQMHRLKDRLRRQHARAAHLHDDVRHAGLLLLGRVLVGDGPARHLAR